MPEIAIATTTRYASPTELRCKLAQAMIREAVSNQNIPVVIVDGSHRADVQQALKEAGGQVIEEESPSTMGAAWRQALREAARLETEVVVLMQPEKRPMVEDLPILAQPILSGAADIVVPSRTEEGFRSYPNVQRLAEQYGNEIFRRLTGFGLDVWLGVRLISRNSFNFFLQYNGDYSDKWDAIFIPLLRAQKAGLSIWGVSTDYKHPPEQREQEENDDALGILKRQEQLQNLIEALCTETELLKFFG